MSTPTKFTLATMYGPGLVKYGPGTAGSLVAALIAWPVLMLPYGWVALIVGTILFTVLGTKSATRYMIAHNTAHDPSEIVIDELVGQWLTYTVWHLWLAAMAGSNTAALELIQEMAASPLWLVLGFVLFRFFDILKPWPISWADRKIKGGFGVMFDDLLAAIPAGTVLYLLYLFSPLVFGHVESTA
jgi:phosphatidylglycerophosphatase A